MCTSSHFSENWICKLIDEILGGVPAPGHVTKYVRVPLRVVGLVVGPKGATIKRIQQDTHTYIITPSREREPIFEVFYNIIKMAILFRRNSIFDRNEIVWR